MSPKIIEYQGIEISFYSDEHEPIHVHCKYGDYQVKAELYIMDKKVSEIKYKKIKGRDLIPEAKLKEVKVLIDNYKDVIVQNWINYFLYQSKVKCLKITIKLKWP